MTGHRAVRTLEFMFTEARPLTFILQVVMPVAITCRATGITDYGLRVPGLLQRDAPGRHTPMGPGSDGRHTGSHESLRR